MKMNAKFSLALIALVGIGVFALPSTVALFSGQHSFYNIDATGNQIPCVKCHGDVKAELSSGASSTTGTPGPHAAFKCEYCHRVEQGSASGDNAYGKVTYKGATTSRYLILPVADLEASNFPKQINGNDVVINFTTLAGVKLQYGKGVISDTTVDVTLNTTKDNWRIYPTYNATSGLPLDQNPATQNTGLDLSQATVDSKGNVNLNNSGSKSVNPGSTYHAASLVSCMECHGGDEPMGHYTRIYDGEVYSSGPCSDCHYGGGGAITTGAKMTTLQAGGFGLTSAKNDTGTVEAHNAWVKTNDNISRFDGPNGEANNDACIACHTHVAVQINFKKGYLLQFNATESPTGDYTVGNGSVQGTVNVTTYGNSSGNAFAVSDKNYNWTSTVPLYVNGVLVQSISGTNDNITQWAVPSTTPAPAPSYTQTLTSIVVSPATATLGAGASLTFVAYPLDQNGTLISGLTVTWSRSNSTVGSISSTGKFTALAAGTTMVNATIGSVKGTATVTVGSAPSVLTTISISPATASIPTTGGTQLFTATPKDQYGNTMAGTVTWAATVGTFDSPGLLNVSSGTAAGTYVVTATSGGIISTATVTVYAPTLTTISVTPPTATKSNAPDVTTQTFSATLKDQNGKTMSGSATWSAPAAAGTIDASTGVLNTSGATPGTYTVTATSGLVSGTATVTVSAYTPVLTTIVVSPPSVSINGTTGGTQTFSANGFDQYSNPMVASVTWSTDVGTIGSTTGVLTVGMATAPGTYTVTATSGGKTGTATVTVTT